ncbi:MarR family winged helix-turn-helix transcriptional regulator [Stackebrandtia nassauensis]|uniref:Transcriptional regulator, MarR family n=1 Tax=Stackebrandtia nassauensis (strain DSM 44728 / CIP 108903 / NRRL B-16338 / NBRC 102104 / LLR-40K-21) TaxID=446470 RepID=D3Q867_STANL|nr:MarR family transcriptional regulator [Stackebrandtia nassauensis]ADD42441.1 transcriptional regulator, MarR family [Stackebrandtia nassauensis DSM 44728]
MEDNVDRRLDQWRVERPDIDTTAMGVVARIQRANRLLERELRANFAKHDLQLWEFDILGTLRRNGPPFQLTAGQLVESAMVTSGAITNRIDRLVARGLVTREVDPDNRRSVLITLSDKGRELIDPVVESHANLETQLLGKLSDRDQEQLAGLLRRLLLDLGDGSSGNPLVP